MRDAEFASEYPGLRGFVVCGVGVRVCGAAPKVGGSLYVAVVLTGSDRTRFTFVSAGLYNSSMETPDQRSVRILSRVKAMGLTADVERQIEAHATLEASRTAIIRAVAAFVANPDGVDLDETLQALAGLLEASEDARKAFAATLNTGAP